MSGSRGEFTPVGLPGPCEKLNVKTALQSPDPAVVARITKGDVLDLQLKRVSNNRQAVVVLKDGKVAGSLVFASLQKLIECLEAGHKFVAEVLTKSGPACQLQVRPQ